MPGAGRARIARAAKTLGLVLLFVLASVVGVALHVDLPASRRIVAHSVESFLNSTFRGRFELGSIERLTSGTLKVSEVRVRDPQGVLVLSAKGLRVRADGPNIASVLLGSSDDATLVVRHVRAERVDVVILPDPKSGAPTLASAFELARPAAPGTAPKKPSVLRVWFPAIEVARGVVRGHLDGTPTAEGEVSGVQGAVLISPLGVAVDAPRFSTVLRGAGGSAVRGVASFHQRGTTHFFGSFDGYVGELQVNSVARLDGKRLTLTLDVPNADPASVRAFLPDWPVLENVVAHVEARGEIPVFQTDARFVVGGSSEVTAKGSVALGKDVGARLAVTGAKVDLRAVLPDSPPTSFDVEGELIVRVPAEGPVLEYTGATEATLIAGIVVPAANFTGRYTSRGAEGRATLHEPGMPVELVFAITPDGVVDLDGHARHFRIENAERLARLVPARGDADVRVKGRIVEGRFDATLEADVQRLLFGPAKLATGHAKGRLVGSFAELEALRLDVTIDGTDLQGGAFAFERANAKVIGPLRGLDVVLAFTSPGGQAISAKTKLAAIGGTRLDEVELEIRRDDAALRARAARVDLSEGSIEAKNVEIEGAGGTLTASGRYRPGLFELEAHGRDVDLDVMRRVLGLSRETLGGKLDLDVEVVAARDVRKGEVRLEIEEGAAGPITGVKATFSATLDGNALEGQLSSQVKGYGSLRASWEVAAPNELFDAEEWRKVTGRVDLGLEGIELSQLVHFLPADVLRIAEVRGVAMAQLTLLRSEPDLLPSASFLVTTSGLALGIASEKGGEETLDVAGVEAQLGGTVDGRSGATDVSLRLVDQYGVLVSSTGHVDLDLAAAFAGNPSLAQQLKTRPLAIAALIDGRPINELPEPFRPKDVLGTLRAEANLRGTLEAPVFSAKVALGGLTLGEEVQAKPFDACLRGQYDPADDRIGFGGEIYVDDPALAPCAGKRVALASAAGKLDLAAARAGRRAFQGDAQLALEDLPLEFVTPLGRARIAGLARGRAALVQGGEAPQLSARFTLTKVRVREFAVGDGVVELRSNGRDLRANVELERTQGHLKGEGRAGLDWEGLVPALDRKSPLTATASVHNVDAAVLEPLLDDVVSDLAGRLDGNVRIALVPAPASAEGGSGWTGDVSGKLSLDQGSLQLAGLGMRLSRVRFEAEAKKVGRRTVISVRKLSAASRSKHPNVSASADLYLEGLDLRGGRANVNLREVPFMIAGTPQATLTGSGAVTLERLPDRLRVEVRLPKMIAELPRSSGRGVLPLEEHDDIEILQPVAEPVRPTGGNALPWELGFDLGDDVGLRRADLQIPLRGRPVVFLADDVAVRGDLELEPGGRVTLLGKVFVIEQGEVHFDTGDASNPRLRVLASWRAPDGTIVHVEVRGTYREATLRLESDPARPEAEIQALLLGGGGTAQTAGVGYGADFLGELLADTSLPHVEFRAGSEATSDDRTYQTYTAAVQLSDEVWFETSYKDPNAAEPTEESSAAVSGAVDWRFRENWSLRTEVGNIGYGLDLLWQYRY